MVILKLSESEKEDREMRLDYIERIFKEQRDLGRQIATIENAPYSLKKWEKKCGLIARDRYLTEEKHAMWELVFPNPVKGALA